MDSNEGNTTREASGVTAIVIQTDGQHRTVDIQSPTLTDLQSLVGGYIEGIGLGADYFGYINEEGKLLGLARNDLATDFWSKCLGRPVSDCIRGPLVIVGPTTDDGEDSSVDVAAVEALLKEIKRV